MFGVRACGCHLQVPYLRADPPVEDLGSAGVLGPDCFRWEGLRLLVTGPHGRNGILSGRKIPGETALA